MPSFIQNIKNALKITRKSKDQGPKTPEGRNLLRELAEKQPLLSGLEIRTARINGSRSIVPSRKRYKMWARSHALPKHGPKELARLAKAKKTT